MSKKNNSDLTIDNLRLDLGYMDPQHHDLRWNVAKQEIAQMTETSGPSKFDIGYICLLLGVGLGIYGVKWFPKTKTVKLIKYTQEALKARKRLNKIAIEEYHRLDEAIETEEQFLNMMGQDLPVEIKLKYTDEDGDRGVQLEFHNKKKDKKENE